MAKVLEELEVFILSQDIGELIWCEVINWDYFAKNSIGNQLVRSTDSISANIAESYGRFSFREKRQFLFYSRGSLIESKIWIIKAKNRKLISEKSAKIYSNRLQEIHRLLNGYINYVTKSNK